VAACVLVPARGAAAQSCVSPTGSSGQETVLNGLLQTGGAGTVVSLCPSSVFKLSNPVVFTAAGQEISTAGYPTDATRATLVVTGAQQSSAIVGQCAACSGIRVRNVQVNGNRPALGVIASGAGLIEIGGEVSGQLVQYVHSYEPRGWSALHVFEGALDCSGVSVLSNDIGPSGAADGNWADGISYACRNGTVADNVVTDATDGGIVVFQAPGTTVEHNTIVAQTRDLLGGINMVDYKPYSGNYAGTVVTHNTVYADGAMIKVGIAMGPAVWTTDTTDTNSGGTVTQNTIHGAGLGYAMAVNGVSGFTIENNVGSGVFGGQAPSYNPPGQPFLINPGRSSGSFSGQSFATADAFQYLIGIQPRLATQSAFAAGALLLTGGTSVEDAGPLFLSMQADSNLVLYSVGAAGGTTTLWTSKTSGQSCGPTGTACKAAFEPNGDLAVVDASGKTVWSTNTDNPNYPGKQLLFSSQEPYLAIVDAKQDVLWAENNAFSDGQLTLKGGQFAQIGSAAGQPFFLAMQTDGNLVMYASTEYSGSIKPLWASNTAGHSCSHGCMAAFQGDGNFVLYDGTIPYWASNTNGARSAGAMLILSGTKPYIKILDKKGGKVWSTSVSAATLWRSYLRTGDNLSSSEPDGVVG
jgi:hypothetical protein